MNGYETNSYGDAFADVYDQWYHDVSDVDQTVQCLLRLTLGLTDFPIVELGVGTGRIALALAAAVHPQPIIGIDSSQAMLAKLADKDPGQTVGVICGDMGTDLPGGPVAGVFVAYNTFFGLTEPGSQAACMRNVARCLAPGGFFAIEAFVPDESRANDDHVEVRTLAADCVVLSVSRSNADSTVDGQFIQFTQAEGVRLRPWRIRPTSPSELDAMAAAAGLVLTERYEDFGGTEFTVDSVRHVSVYHRL